MDGLRLDLRDGIRFRLLQMQCASEASISEKTEVNLPYSEDSLDDVEQLHVVVDLVGRIETRSVAVLVANGNELKHILHGIVA